jgi:hypothetical protein
MNWRLAAAADTLRKQVNTRYPKRDRDSDGTIGDQAHRRRISDHNPDKQGFVMALDLDEDGWPAHVFADQLIAYMRTSNDKRIKNIVYENRVASGTYSDVKGQPPRYWQWRPAKGMGHEHHIHISFNLPARYDGRPFPLAILTNDMPLGPTIRNDSLDGPPSALVPAKRTRKKATAPKP